MVFGCLVAPVILSSRLFVSACGNWRWSAHRTKKYSLKDIASYHFISTTSCGVIIKHSEEVQVVK